MGKKDKRLTKRTIIGALLGILCGVVLGQDAEIFSPIGLIYVRLLEAAVYPYVIASLLSSLGQLTPSLSTRLFKHLWRPFLFLLLLSLSMVMALSHAFPIQVVHSKEGIELDVLLAMLVPANLFHALNNNYVPAVIIFCVLFGLRLQQVKEKKELLHLLDNIAEVCLHFWRWVVQFSPVAVFALLANAAGTVAVGQLVYLSHFLLLFFFGTFFLCFWVLPTLIASLTCHRYKDILANFKTPLLFSAVTTLSVVALPYIIETLKKEIAKQLKTKQNTEEQTEIIETSLFIAYPFCQLGNLFVYLFIVFSTFYFNQSIKCDIPLLIGPMTYLATVGSPSAMVNAVDFLTSWLHLSKHTPELFVSTLTLTRYGQVLASVMGMVFFATIVSYSYFGLIRVQVKKLIMTLLITALACVAMIILTKQSIPHPALEFYERMNEFTINEKAVPIKKTHGHLIKNKTKDALFAIQSRGLLKVGYHSHMRPFSYFNRYHQLVGYDVAMMYKLATSLGVKVQFIPYKWSTLQKDIQLHHFDVAIGGIYVTFNKLADVNFSTPYFYSPLSFIVKKEKARYFASIDTIKKLTSLRIITNDDIVLDLSENSFFQHATFIKKPFFDRNTIKLLKENKVDAILASRERAKQLILPFTGYAVIEQPRISSSNLFAYMTAKDSPLLTEYINYWLRIQKQKEYKKSFYNKWILGIPPQEKNRDGVLDWFFSSNKKKEDNADDE